MEAFMYRAHPQTATLLDILKSGVIGGDPRAVGQFRLPPGHQMGG